MPDADGSRIAALRRRPRLVVARRDLASLSREKTIVLALAIQLFVAAFSSVLVVGLTSLYDPSAVAPGATVDVGVAGDARDALVSADDDVEGVRTVEYATPEAATDAFAAGRVDAVLVATRAGGRVAVRAAAPEGSLWTTLVVTRVRELLEALERNERTARAASLDARPVPLPPEPSASPYFGFTYTVLLPVLLFLPVFISGSVVVDVIAEEVERGTLELLRVAPVSAVAIVDAKAGAMAALAPAQAALWLALLALNGTRVAHVPALLLVVTALAVVFVAVGTAVALVAADRRTAQLAYSVAALVAFAAAALLPEHPATTVATLAIDSPTPVTYALVAGYAVAAVVLAAGVRRFVARQPPEAL